MDITEGLDLMAEATVEFINDDQLDPRDDSEGRFADLLALSRVRDLWTQVFAGGAEDVAAYHKAGEVYVVTVQDPNGRILDQEVMSSRPTFPPEKGTTVRVANVNGGDSVTVDSMEHGFQADPSQDFTQAERDLLLTLVDEAIERREDNGSFVGTDWDEVAREQTAVRKLIRLLGSERDREWVENERFLNSDFGTLR